MNKRIYYIDLAKSFGVLLVIFGHVYKTHDSIYWFIYSFHMPFFFILSGYFFDPSKYKKTKDYIYKRLVPILIPYLFFYVITYLYWLLIESRFRGAAGGVSVELWRPIIGLFYGSNFSHFMEHNTPLWFIPCLISVEFIIIGIHKFQSIVVHAVIILVFSFIGYFFLQSHYLLLPWGLSQAFIALIFYYNAKYIRLIHNVKFKFKSIIFLFMVIIYLQFFIEFIPSSDMFVMNFSNIYLFVFYAFFTSIGLLITFDLFSFFFERFKSLKNVISFFGINSLVILCIHDPIKRVIIYVYSKVFSLSIVSVRESFENSLICTLLVVAVLVPFIIGYNKYFKLKLANFRI